MLLDDVLQIFGIIELIVNFKVGRRHDLEERLTVEVHIIEGGVLLIVDIGVCESEFKEAGTLWK